MSRTHIISRDGVITRINLLLSEPDGSKANEHARAHAKEYLSQYANGLREFANKNPKTTPAKKCNAVAARLELLVNNS